MELPHWEIDDCMVNRLMLNNDKSGALLVGSRKRVSVLQDNHPRVCINDISLKAILQSQGLH